MRGLDASPAGLGQRFEDQHFFKLVGQFFHDAGLAAMQSQLGLAAQRSNPILRAGHGGLRAHFRRQILDLDSGCRRHHRQPVAKIFQLPYVTRQILYGDVFERGLCQSLRFNAKIARTFLQKKLRQQRDILAPLAQGRQAQTDDIQPVKQILAEQSLLDPRFEILVGRRDDTYIGLDRLMSADSVKIAVGEHPQQPRLQFLRHVANFVEKQRAAFGLLETPAAHVLRAGKCAALMPEQLGLQQFLGDRRGVDRDERPARTRTVAMQRAGYQFLAGPRLAGNHYCGMRLRQATDGAEHFLHCGRLTEYFRYRLADFAGGVLAHAFVHRATNQFHRMINVKGLGQIFISAPLERRHGAFQIGIRGHDDHRQRRMAQFGLFQQFQARLARHADVADHDLRSFILQRHQRLARRSKRLECDVLAGQGFFEHPAYRAVVVNNPDRFHMVSQSISGAGWSSNVPHAVTRAGRPAPGAAM